MDNILSIMSSEERAAFSLCALYESAGYQKYRMSKFEEYALYVQNKDFLVSENVITFTDTDGKLLALKPDVTLSIIKNTRTQSGVMKVYYKENIYRVSGSTKSFKELMQAGLECLGEVTTETVIEVLSLAKKSLDYISSENVLEISHLDIVSGVLSACSVSEQGRREILMYLGEKNESGMRAVALREGLSAEAAAWICRLVTLYDAPEKVLPALDALALTPALRAAIEELRAIVAGLRALGISDKLIIDFSVVNDMNYYNGIAFKGFVNGVPAGVLSGGEYDSLLKKMKKNEKGIGFAVYMDELSRLADAKGAGK
ncbi:MAG: ATP phosphoribosyltransferase regulatory subunit [Clostridia bacterium]|nr:ATP phosphoribosyltransferase regulatory subunit [Clostridia bacterium]